MPRKTDTDDDLEAATQKDHIRELLIKDAWDDAHEQAVFFYNWSEMAFQFFVNENLPQNGKC